MESIETIIGEGRALELRFDSRHRQLDAESWFATLSLQEFDENDNEIDDGSVLASAMLVRVNLQHEDWFDSLDVESGDLARVGEALSDRFLIADVDEDLLFVDEPKRRGLRRHWKRGGFVGVPGTEVMILPLGER